MYNIIIPVAVIHLAVMNQQLQKARLVLHVILAQRGLLLGVLEGAGLAQVREKKSREWEFGYLSYGPD